MKDGYYIIYDIGTYSAKSALIEVSNGQKKLTSIDYEILKQLKEFISENDYYLHIQEIIKVLSLRLPINEAQNIIAVLNHRDIQIKIIDLPESITKQNLQQTLYWEAKKLLNPTYKNESFIYGWEIIKEKPNLSLLLGVAPYALIERFEKIFSELGIFLHSVIPAPFCNTYYKKFLEFYHNPNSTISFIEIGHNSTIIQIYNNSELKFFRFIPSGASDFIDTLSRNEIENYTQKIRFSFDYFRASTKISNIETIMICGGGAKIKELFDFIREYFHPSTIDFTDFSRVLDTSLFENKSPLDSFLGYRYLDLLPYSTALAAFSKFESINNYKIDESLVNIDFIRSLRELELEDKINFLSKRVFLYTLLIGVFIISGIIYFWQSLLIHELEEIRNKTTVINNSIIAANLKLNQKSKLVMPYINFTPQEKSFLEPLFTRNIINYQLDRLLYFIERKRPKGVKIFKINIKSKEQLETEIGSDLSDILKFLSNKNTALSSDNSESDTNSELGTQSNSSQMQEQDEFKTFEKIETIGGDVIQIIGTAQDLTLIGSYVNNLQEVNVISNIRSMNYKAYPINNLNNPEKIFIIQGELR